MLQPARARQRSTRRREGSSRGRYVRTSRRARAPGYHRAREPSPNPARRPPRRHRVRQGSTPRRRDARGERDTRRERSAGRERCTGHERGADGEPITGGERRTQRERGTRCSAFHLPTSRHHLRHRRRLHVHGNVGRLLRRVRAEVREQGLRPARSGVLRGPPGATVSAHGLLLGNEQASVPSGSLPGLEEVEPYRAGCHCTQRRPMLPYSKPVSVERGTSPCRLAAPATTSSG